MGNLMRLGLAAALLLGSFVIPGSPARAEAPISPEPYLNADGTLNLPEDFSGSLDLTGWDVMLDPLRGAVFAPAEAPAAATLGAWSSLGGPGTGLNGEVFSILVDGGTLYAGGNFTNAGGDPDADRIAKFEGGTWTSLGGAGTGLDSYVFALLMVGGTLYAGGRFTDAGGDADADRIAKFEGGAWSSLGGAGTGLNNTVYALLMDGGTLYAGGQFTDAGGDADADRIAKFEGGAWSSLGGAGTGLNNSVGRLLMDGGTLYAGGNFTNAGGDADADYIAKFEGGAWSSLDGAGTGLNNYVYSMALDGGTLYAGGVFTNAGGDADADYIAKFEGGAWSSLGGAGTELSAPPIALLMDGGTLYAGGGFTDAGGDTNADRIAKFEGGAWSSLGGAGTGLSDSVLALLMDSGTLYAGDYFSNAGGDADADRIAQYGLSDVTAPDVSSTTLALEITTELSSFDVVFSEDVNDPVGDSDADDVTNPDNYLLVEAGTNAAFDTLDCAGGVVADDTQVTVTGITYDNGTFTATVTLAAPLPNGTYRLHVCGTTSIVDLALNAINGGADVTVDFTVNIAAAGGGAAVTGGTGGVIAAAQMPATGFAPGVVTQLPAQPADRAYASTDLILSIPRLGVETAIVGVPQGPDGWDVTWLGQQAGYLYGTAFPTWAGNTVITAHVWDANNNPGPFANLADLQHGDTIEIAAFGQTYVYEVRTTDSLRPTDTRTAFAHSDYDILTLITCEGFDARTGEYAARRVVTAVLVEIR